MKDDRVADLPSISLHDSRRDDTCGALLLELALSLRPDSPIGKDLAYVIVINRDRGELHVRNSVRRQKSAVTGNRLDMWNLFDLPAICLWQQVKKCRLAMRDQSERARAIAEHLIDQARQTDQRREYEHRDGDRQGSQNRAALVACEIAKNESEVIHARAVGGESPLGTARAGRRERVHRAAAGTAAD